MELAPLRAPISGTPASASTFSLTSASTLPVPTMPMSATGCDSRTSCRVSLTVSSAL
ncbi:MAG: hypothetical protein MZW92_25260 [Comamonadaceae bacterium]|nr:hypothetical protein [Comamonadaceae bacterium]